jgi:ubiquinone/menaquinone biosynthesis C-methylase UbiE
LPAVQSTIRTNSELVPQRAQQLAALWKGLDDQGDRWQGARVLEAGCGFGALAAYFAVVMGAREVVGIDSRLDFVTSANRSSEELGLADRLRYVHADMRALNRVGGERFDVVVANNALIYLPSKREMFNALTEFRRVLRPGGRVVFFHANRWQWREPFTRSRLVHLLPAPVAKGLAPMTGWKHSHGRVTLVSPPQMVRMLRTAGFQAARFGALDHGAVRRSRRIPKPLLRDDRDGALIADGELLAGCEVGAGGRHVPVWSQHLEGQPGDRVLGHDAPRLGLISGRANSGV